VITLPIIVNPIARGGRTALPREDLERIGASAGFKVEWWETTGPGHAVELATKGARDGAPMVAAWGGDGTYNEVARGLVGGDAALVVLPGGTSSVLAWELGIPRRAEDALRAQLAGSRRKMNVGRTDRGQLFLLMLSVGPDSVILNNIPQPLKVHGGKVGITIQAFVEFARAQLPDFVVQADGHQVRASWCIVGNGKYYGGPYRATPGADPFEQGFEVVTLERHGRTAVVPFFFAIPTEHHLRMRGVRRFPAREVVLDGDDSIPFQLDGDPAGVLPVTARAVDEHLWVTVPTSPVG